MRSEQAGHRTARSRCGRVAAGLAIGAIAALTVAGLVAAPAEAGAPRQDGSDVGEAERQLAERFAPVMMLKDQEEPCDLDGEPFAPTRVDIVLDNPQVALRQLGRENPTVTRAPGAADLYGLGEGFFLDFPGDSLRPGCIYEHDFQTYAADVPVTVYAHVVQQPDEPDLVFVQYWFYWYYNDWNNKHESDWEGITLKFEASSVEEALASEPVAVGYSQHEGGERADWDADKLERDGDHPLVYSSARSHASYYGSSLYLGRAASEGFGCDDTSGPSTAYDPEVVLLPDAVDDADDPLAWLGYRGRWGERQEGAFNGPTGPAAKDRWLEPAPWFEELRDSSVVIPAGDSGAASVIGVFCGTVEWGSQTLIGFTTSPARVVVALLVVVLLVRFLVGRTDWSAVPSEPVVRRRRAGQLIRAAVREYRGAPAVFILFGLVYIPAALVAGVLGAVVELIPFVSSITALAGQASGTSLVLAALVGSIANVAAFVTVNGVVSEYLGGEGRGFDAALRALRTAWDRRRDLFGAFVRSFAIVFALLATFVGAPWGVRQLVRYQFIAQAVMFDDRSGADALARSTEVTRGRWWHTAIVAVALNLFVGATALVVALLLLVLAAGIPLWIFSGLVSLVYALVVPLAAIAMTLLYGDAVAELSGSEQPEPVEVA